MKYLSVCSGIEAASVAWEPLGWSSVAFAEIDRAASALLARRFPGVPNLGDFTALDVAALGPVDLLVGGTPCQAFSVAGRRASLSDARGNLSLSYAVLMHELATTNGLRWAVWENVPGVLSLADNAFGCFLSALVGGDAPVVPPGAVWGPKPHFDVQRYDVHRTFGWQSCSWPRQGLVAGPRARAAWRILDAQYFGLAHRRERVFVVVGVGEGADPAAVLFEPQGLRRHPPSRGEAGEAVAATLTRGAESRGRGSYAGRRREDDVNLIAHTLRAEGFDASEDGTGRGTPIVPICFDPRQADFLIHGDRTGPLDTKFPGPAIAFDTTQITSATNRSDPQPGDPCHPLAAQGHPPALAFQDRFRGDDGRGYDRAPQVSSDIVGTLETVKPWNVATAWAVRRLTPTECERLQGFPDGWTEGQADGPRYKQLGNSMAVPVVRWLGRRITAVDAAARP